MKLDKNVTSTARYLAALDAAFGGWGGAAEWAWVFERDAGAGAATTLVLSDEAGEWLAGSGVSWREVGGLGLVGIMTGSWTSPAARGRGCFAALIDASREAVRARGGAALLAFVTENNASRRRLEAAGASMHPTSYARTLAPLEGAVVRTIREVALTPALLQTLYVAHRAGDASAARVAYPEISHFEGQFVARPTRVRALALGDDAYALVEQAEDTDRVLLLVGPQDPASEPGVWRDLACLAGREGRKLFGFAADAPHRAAVHEAGLDVVRGFLTEEPLAASTAENGLRWVLQSGDRM